MTDTATRKPITNTSIPATAESRVIQRKNATLSNGETVDYKGAKIINGGANKPGQVEISTSKGNIALNHFGYYKRPNGTFNNEAIYINQKRTLVLNVKEGIVFKPSDNSPASVSKFYRISQILKSSAGDYLFIDECRNKSISLLNTKESIIERNSNSINIDRLVRCSPEVKK